MHKNNYLEGEMNKTAFKLHVHASKKLILNEHLSFSFLVHIQHCLVPGQQHPFSAKWSLQVVKRMGVDGTNV